MIIKEFYRTRLDGVNLYKTYSNNNVYIQKKETDEIYSEAIDTELSNYEYIETEKIIEQEDYVIH